MWPWEEKNSRSFHTVTFSSQSPEAQEESEGKLGNWENLLNSHAVRGMTT